MNLTHLSQLRYIFLRRKSNLFLYMRFSSHVDPLRPVKLINPFKKRRRPPIPNENESRIANRICITIIGNGGIGQPRCLGLFTDLKSYFFNCGEGVGRFCREYDINMCAVRHIFVTQKKWENLSGISDVHLTNQTYGISYMSIHGPPGIEHFQSIVSSEKAAYTELRFRDLSKSLFIDHTLQIQHVPVRPENEAFLSGISRSSNMNSGNPDVSYSYICKIFEKPGDFLVEKCVEYGVPLGPDLLKLKSGKNVIVPSGKTVNSEDVHTQPYPGTVILVVDCPSEDFLDAFINNKTFETYQLPLNASLEVSNIFHFTPPHIFSCAKYQDWISRFHQDTQHFVLNSDNPTASSIAIHLSQKYFHMLHPDIFSNLKEVKESSSFSSSKAPTVFHPPPMLQLHIRPEKKLSWTNVVDRGKGNEEDGTEAAKGSPEFYDKLHQLKRILSRQTVVNDPNETYPEVIFLGTSSSTSSAYRNVSAILVNTSSNQSILLDCGEGAMMQLTRYYGSDVYAMLRQIACIFISHKHTDHYMGLFQLVSQRVEAFRILGVPYVPLVLVLPYEIEHMFRTFCEIFEDLTMAVRIFGCNYLGKKRENKLSQFLGNIELLTVPVKHCQDAHGIVLELTSQWKIVYSGDSAPSQKLIHAGTDCTLLIHEASIEDGLVNEALAKKHSTPSQVIDVAEKMNAKYTVTTHFSKRYLALPVFPDCSERHITHAFDFMKVRMCDWPLLPLFTPIIKSLFQEQLDTHSERTSSVANFENMFLKVLKT